MRHDEPRGFVVIGFNLRAGFARRLGSWQLGQLIRLDNAGDKRHAGSVIVNDANERFFEPAPPRKWRCR